VSNAPQLRRTDRQMSEARLAEILENAYCGRLATVGADGWPYVVPLMYVWMKACICVHMSAALGHLRKNIAHSARACFEIDAAGEVFAYGRFECDTGTSYASVIAFGRLELVEARDEKSRFCEALMAKYAARVPDGRPKSFFPRLDHIVVYALAIERITGKETVLPTVSEQWPVLDRTKTPGADAEVKKCSQSMGRD
jgi:uncharacterized protein